MENNKNEKQDKLNEYLRKRALGLIPIEKSEEESSKINTEENKPEVKNQVLETKPSDKNVEEKQNQTNLGKNAEEKSEEIKFCRLEKEIKAEEESRKLVKQKKEKTKKTPEEIAKGRRLRSKIISWALGATIFAGSVFGIGSLVKNCNSEESKIKREFAKANKTITAVLEDDTRYYLEDRNITHLYFQNPENLVVYYTATDPLSVSRVGVENYAIYEVLEQYYNNLVEAEGNNDPVEYIKCLNTIFETMTLKEEGELSSYEPITLENATEENIEKFNNIFSAGIQDDNIVRHLGFLPYYVNPTDISFDSDTRIYSCTYKIFGISYCEINTESSSYVKESGNLVMTKNYDSNKIKSYNRELTFTSSIVVPEEYMIGSHNHILDSRFSRNSLSHIINEILKNENHEYSIQTDYFEQTDLFDMYEKIKAGEYTKKK